MAVKSCFLLTWISYTICGLELLFDLFIYALHTFPTEFEIYFVYCNGH